MIIETGLDPFGLDITQIPTFEVGYDLSLFNEHGLNNLGSPNMVTAALQRPPGKSFALSIITYGAYPIKVGKGRWGVLFV
ncbi:hypothetical protein V6N13_009427 [Hibiscus sabdariffa]|uniref:Uncharacterized protein n=1 Tax=Hibiscus sabdariffa TaxID=183260 RepID=A0ABR2PP06_9ROSI